MNADYCRTVCKTRCAECPAPRLLPECSAGVVAYSACATQWRAAGMGGRTGLDYTACIGVLGQYLPKWQHEGSGEAFTGLDVADLMADVQVIEAAILGADAERGERERSTHKA